MVPTRISHSLLARKMRELMLNTRSSLRLGTLLVQIVRMELLGDAYRRNPSQESNGHCAAYLARVQPTVPVDEQHLRERSPCLAQFIDEGGERCCLAEGEEGGDVWRGVHNRARNRLDYLE